MLLAVKKVKMKLSEADSKRGRAKCISVSWCRHSRVCVSERAAFVNVRSQIIVFDLLMNI